MTRQELPVLKTPRPAVDAPALRAALLEKIQGDVRFDRLSRALYSTDASVYQIVPLGVVAPRNADDVAAVVRICSHFGVPITARGGGTSQAGQAIGPGIVLDFSRYLNRILEINAFERWARVEPGCVLDDLNAALKPHGLLFAPDISTSNRATIGGMIANNSSGTHSLIHGKTIDHVPEVKVLLADGTIIQARPQSPEEVRAKCARQNLEGECYRLIRRLAADHAAEIDRRFPKILRRVGGYNLDCFGSGDLRPPLGPGFNMANLFVGSEGTLGIILEARLRLVELPRARAVMVVHFSQLLDALAATPGILAHEPSAIEVIDKYVLESTRLNPEASRLRDFLAGDPGAILIVEFYADEPAALSGRLDALEADLRGRGAGYHYHRALASDAQGRIWKLRKAALGLSMAEKGDAKALSFVEDSAVAPERLRDYIEEFLGVIAAHGTTAGVYAHASVGCLHVRPVIDLKTADGVRRFEAIAGLVSDLVLKYGGALSGEHGDGLVRSPFQEKMFGPVLYQAFREIKRTFDPRGIFNPGKIVDAPPLASNLRYGPAYVTPDVPTTFDFSADGGMVRAAELCAGVGECRKKADGVMCPSFQATREEQHCTRGRANALRLALTGQLGFHGLTDPELFHVLDLCLECKACKSECPTNVDMARLKAEFLHQYYREHGLPWRQRIFAHVAGLARWGSAFPRLYNWTVRSRTVRWLNEKLFGIDSRRLPPALATAPFPIQEIESPAGQLGPEVLFFPDTFTRFFEPDLARAVCGAVRQLGGLVRVARPRGFPAPPGLPAGIVCCGRPMISNGLLDQAVDCARINVESLFPWARASRPIIAAEPSCLLTIKDDYPALLRGDLRRQAQVVAQNCRTFEELALELLDQASFSRLPPAGKILVQAHCHQRSLVGTGPLLGLLRKLTGAPVIDLDAGCCGLAGSFGYEVEHYELSRQVGEQRLFPALRRAAPDDLVVAPGFSCRMQIGHFTGKKAIHPAELLREGPYP